MVRRTKVLLGSTGALLVAAIALQTCSLRNTHWGSQNVRIASSKLQLIPRAVTGWEVHDEPIGTTELLDATARRELNFDDYLFRVYRRGGVEFGVFITYWSPNRMATHRVISHTPDICWPMNGWRCLEYDLKAVDLGRGGTFSPGYWRRFRSPEDRVVHVVYWHVVSGQLYDFGGNRFNQVIEPFRWWREAMCYGILGNGEQYFIRLTSNAPIEEIAEDEGVRGLLSAVGHLGLFSSAADTKPQP